MPHSFLDRVFNRPSAGKPSIAERGGGLAGLRGLGGGGGLGGLGGLGGGIPGIGTLPGRESAPFNSFIHKAEIGAI